MLNREMTAYSRLVSQVVAAGLCVAVAVVGMRACAASAQAAGSVAFADWTAVGDNVATGTLLGHEVTFSGTVVDDPPSSTVDGSSNLFSESMFTPPIALGDHLSFRISAPSSSYTLDFGSPTTDPIIDLGSDGSTLTFPAGTNITRVSGDAGLTVTGNVVTGAGNLTVDPVGLNDSNGTIQLDGTFQTISFTATTDYSLDGVYIQVGAHAPGLTPPTSPPATPQPPVARLSVAPNPTCVDVATTLDASASTGDRPIVRYGFEYHERDANGSPDPLPIVLADSSSPKATVRFPWSREESAATWGNQQVSIWVRRSGRRHAHCHRCLRRDGDDDGDRQLRGLHVERRRVRVRAHWPDPVGAVGPGSGLVGLDRRAGALADCGGVLPAGGRRVHGRHHWRDAIAGRRG